MVDITAGHTGRRSWKAGFAAGGTDHGAPCLRPHYHPQYCGAFMPEPDGYNIEVVCHYPE